MFVPSKPTQLSARPFTQSALLSILLAVATVATSANAQLLISGFGRPLHLRGRYGIRYYNNPYAALPYTTTNYGYGYGNYTNYYYDPAMRLKQELWERENGASKKLEFERSVDARVARAELDRLTEIKRGLTRFVNGGGQAMDAAGFRAALTQIEASHTQTQFMQQQIQAVAPEVIGEFAARGIVTGTGELKIPPYVLYNGTEADPSHTAWVRLNDSWSEARWNLYQGKMAAPQHVAGIDAAINQWDQAAQMRLVSSSNRDRKVASSYLTEAKRLVRNLRDQVASMQLAQHLNVGRRGFEGGTVGDYARFVAENRVKLKYGTATHQVLTDLAYDIQRSLEEQIAAVAGRIEQLKAQNPAHNSALREQAMMANQSGIAHGYQDGLRPSQLNHPPQSQIAGLGSQAYGAPAVPSESLSANRYEIPVSLRVPGQSDRPFIQEARLLARHP